MGEQSGAARAVREIFAQPGHPAWWLVAAAFALGFGHGLLLDVAQLGYGDWDYFTSQSLVAHRSWFEHGQAPLWSPYHCGGQTLVGNYQARAWSPSFLLVAAAGVQWGNRLYLVLALVLGFEGARRFATRLGAGPWGSLFAALAVAGNGAILARIGIGHFGDVPYLFLPWWWMGMDDARTRPFTGALKGGLWGAFCLLEAGAYPLIYGGLIAGAWLLARSASTRSPRPVLGGAAVLVTTLLLSMFVLWPAARHLSGTLRAGVANESFPPSAIWQAFLSTDILWEKTGRFPEQHWGWWEYGAYVGPVFFVALGASLVGRRRATLAWFALGGLFLWYAMGDVHPAAPWSLAHELPVFRSLRASGRALIPALMCWTFGLAPVLERVRFAPLLVVGFLLNLAFVVPPVLHGAFPTSLAGIEPAASFAQKQGGASMRLLVEENRTRMTAAVLANQGSLRCYEPARGEVHAAEQSPGAPEWVLLGTPGEMAVREWSPNALQIQTRAAQVGGLAVINQNFHDDWVSDDGRPVQSFKGLLAVQVRAGSDQVRLRFDPWSFQLGLVIALLTLLILGAARRYE